MISEVYYLATYVQDVANKLPAHFVHQLQNSIIGYSDERFVDFMNASLPFEVDGSSARVRDLHTLTTSDFNIGRINEFGAFLNSEASMRDVRL